MKRISNRVFAGFLALVMLVTVFVTDARPVLAEDKASRVIEETDTARTTENSYVTGLVEPDTEVAGDKEMMANSPTQSGEKNNQEEPEEKKNLNPQATEEVNHQMTESENKQEGLTPKRSSTMKSMASGALNYDFSANWSTKSTGDYSYPNNDPSSISVTSSNNTQKTVTWAVHLGVPQAQGANFPKGTVKITVPNFIVENWEQSGDTKRVNVDNNGKELPHMTWQVAKAPEESTSIDFNYSDNGDGTYTLTNYKDLNGGFTFDFEQKFSFKPAFVKVDPNGKLQKDYDITLQIDANGDGQNEVEETKKLSLQLQNRLKPGTVKLSVAKKDNAKGTYLTWQNSWGPRPADDDGKTYFYVIWFADYQRGAGTSLPFSAKVTDTGSDGEVVGTGYFTWHDNSFQYPLNTTYPSIAKITDSRTYRQYQGSETKSLPGMPNYWNGHLVLQDMQPCLSQAILKRYPLSLLEGKSADDLRKKGITLSNSVQVDEIADNGQKDQVTAQATETVYFYLGEGSFGKYNVNNAETSLPMARTYLLDGETIRLAGNWNARDHSWHTSSVTRRPNTAKDQKWEMKITQSSPYYIEGKGNDLTNSTLNELFDQKKMTQLSDADYFYKDFYLTWTEYDAAQTHFGEDTGNPIRDYASYQPVEVWIRKKEQPAFEKYAQVKRGQDGAYIATDTNEKPLATSRRLNRTFWALPSDVAEIEYRHKNGENTFQTDMTTYENVVLRPTTAVQALLKASKAAGNNSMVTAVAKRTVGTMTDNTKGQPLAVTAYTLRDLSVSSSVFSTEGKLTDDPEESKQKRRVFDSNYNGAYAIFMDITGGGKSDKELVKRFAFNKGTFYDLLPKDTYVDPKTTELKLNWSYSDGVGNVIPKKNYSVSFVDDYEHSGRTMMIVNYTIPDDLLEFGQGDPQVVFSYDLYNTYENIVDRGTDVLHSVAFVNGNDKIPFHPGDAVKTPDKLADKNFFTNLGKSNAGKIMFNQATVHYQMVTVNQSGLTKKVKTANQPLYVESTTVEGKKVYTYRLRYQTEKGTNADQLVFYDVLDNGTTAKPSAWQGTLQSIDISAIEGKQSAGKDGGTLSPVIYYATTIPTQEQFDVDNGSIWSTTKPQDMKQVKAIAIDCRKVIKGTTDTNFVLEKGASLSVFVHLVAPTDPAFNEKTAVNACTIKTRTFSGTEATASDTVRTLTAEAEVTLKLVTTSFSGQKVWNDANDKDGIRPDAVTITLLANGKDTGKTAKATKENQWKYQFDHLNIYDVDGKKIAYTVKEDPVPGYTTTVKDTTVTNTHNPVPRTSLTVQKVWKHVTPSFLKTASLEVVLYKNGQPTSTKVTLNEQNKFTWTFTDLLTADLLTGQPNQYTVKELDDKGQAADDGAKITLSNRRFTVQYATTGNQITITNTRRFTPTPNPPTPEPPTPNPPTPNPPTPTPVEPTPAPKPQPKPTPTLPVKPQPKTGDSNRLLFWSALLGISVLSLTYLYAAKQKTKRKPR